MTENVKKKNGKIIFNLFVILLSIGLVAYFCLSEDGLVDLAKNVKDFKQIWIVFAFLCMFSDLFLDTILIHTFTCSAKKNYSLRNAFKTCMVGHFYGAITPSQSGSQPMQIYVMNKQGIDPGISTSALVQKFFVYQTTLTLYSLTAILLRFHFFQNKLSPWIWGLAFVGFAIQAFIIILLLLFSFNRQMTHRILTWVCRLLKKIHLIKDYEKSIESWKQQLSNFHESNKILYKNKLLLAKTYVITFFQITSLFVVSYCIYRAMNIGNASVVDMVCAQAFVTMVASLVPLPGSAGASEGSFGVFLSIFFTSYTIKSAILLWRIVTYYAVILVCAPFYRITKKD